MQQLTDLILSQESVFFALFIYGYYSQQQDKLYQRDFIERQQKTLTCLTKNVERIAKNQEHMTEELTFLKNHIQTKGDEIA